MAGSSSGGEQGRLSRVCRTCFDFKEFAKAKLQAMSSQAQEQEPETKPASTDHQCPLGIRGLGRSAWNYLHTLAAYYGYDHDAQTFDNPVPAPQQDLMKRFLEAYARFYPCDHCREDFVTFVSAHPPDARDSPSLSRWMCDLHNNVNARLGYAQFDCAQVNTRWRDGPSDGSCDGQDGGL